MKRVLKKSKMLTYLILNLIQIMRMMRQKIQYSNIFKYINYKLKVQNNLIQFKDKFKNQSCYIIGNGPSLNTSDLMKIRDKYTFASNNIYLINQEINFKPKFYFVTHIPLLKDNNIINFIQEESYNLDIFLPFNALNKDTLSEFKNINYFYAKIFFDRITSRRHFSHNINKYIVSSATVSYSMIQAALYMGFNTIYLLGIDNTKLVQNGGIHFYDNQNLPVKEAVKMTKSYIKVSQVIPKNVKIYNCTRGGMLEVFPRKSLEESLS